MERIEERKQEQREQRRAAEKPSRQAYKKNPKLKGSPRDEEDVRISKTAVQPAHIFLSRPIAPERCTSRGWLRETDPLREEGEDGDAAV